MKRIISVAAFAIGAMLSVGAFAQTTDTNTINFCTAKATGNYFAFASALKEDLKGSLEINVVPTQGSKENLTKLVNGDCQFAVVQSDAYYTFTSDGTNSKALRVERVGAIYAEYAHLICNPNVTDSDPFGYLMQSNKKIAVGPSNAGSRATMEGLIQADKDNGSDYYKNVILDNRDGVRAFTGVMDGTELGCMLYVAGPGTELMTQIANESESASKLKLVNLKDKDFNDTVDRDGKSVYTPTEIKSGWYPGFNYYGNTDTVSVNAVVFASKDWVDNHSDEYEMLLNSFLSTARNFRALKNLPDPNL